MKTLIERLDSAMRRIFYVKGDQGEFVKVRITPINTSDDNLVRFQVVTDNFVAIVEKDKRGRFHFDPSQPHRLLNNIVGVIKRYYMDIVDQ